MNDEIEIAVEDVSLPVRSGFAKIKPEGRGTGEVESLWSYMCRVAYAHGITLYMLVCRLLPELLTGSTKERAIVKVDFLQSYCSSRLNGCFSARLFLSAIEGRLPVDGLESLSNLCLADATNDHRGLRRHRAWCVPCHREDPEPYDRLLWSWNSVTCCNRHEAVLTENCPACGARQRFRGNAFRISECERCSASLVGDAPSIRPDAFAMHVARVASCVIEMGQRGALSYDCVATFWENVGDAGRVPAGGLKELSRLIGYASSTLCGAYHSRPTPSTVLIAKITWISGISVECLLTQRPQILKLGDPHPSWAERRPHKSKSFPVDSDRVLMVLLEQFRADPYRPVFAYEVARWGNVSAKHPSFQFPMVRELLRTQRHVAVRTQRALATWRYCERIRAAILQVESEGCNPCKSRLGRAILEPGILRNEGVRRIRDGFLRAIRAGLRDVLITRTPPLYLQAAAKRAV